MRVLYRKTGNGGITTDVAAAARPPTATAWSWATSRRSATTATDRLHRPRPGRRPDRPGGHQRPARRLRAQRHREQHGPGQPQGRRDRRGRQRALDLAGARRQRLGRRLPVRGQPVRPPDRPRHPARRLPPLADLGRHRAGRHQRQRQQGPAVAGRRRSTAPASWSGFVWRGRRRCTPTTATPTPTPTSRTSRPTRWRSSAAPTAPNGAVVQRRREWRSAATGPRPSPRWPTGAAIAGADPRKGAVILRDLPTGPDRLRRAAGRHRPVPQRGRQRARALLGQRRRPLRRVRLRRAGARPARRRGARGVFVRDRVTGGHAGQPAGRRQRRRDGRRDRRRRHQRRRAPGGLRRRRQGRRPAGQRVQGVRPRPRRRPDVPGQPRRRRQRRALERLLGRARARCRRLARGFHHARRPTWAMATPTACTTCTSATWLPTGRSWPAAPTAPRGAEGQPAELRPRPRRRRAAVSFVSAGHQPRRRRHRRSGRRPPARPRRRDHAAGQRRPGRPQEQRVPDLVVDRRLGHRVAFGRRLDEPPRGRRAASRRSSSATWPPTRWCWPAAPTAPTGRRPNAASASVAISPDGGSVAFTLGGPQPGGRRAGRERAGLPARPRGGPHGARLAAQRRRRRAARRVARSVRHQQGRWLRDVPELRGPVRLPAPADPAVHAGGPPGLRARPQQRAAPAAGGGAPGAARDTARPVLSRVKLSRRSIRARRGRTTLSFRSSERARLSIRVDRVRRGRRARRAAGLTKRIRAGRGRIRLSSRIGRKRLRAGRYRLTLVARDGAGNRSRAKRVTPTVRR